MVLCIHRDTYTVGNFTARPEAPVSYCYELVNATNAANAAICPTESIASPTYKPADVEL